MAKAFGFCMVLVLGWLFCQAVCELAHETGLRNTSKLLVVHAPHAEPWVMYGGAKSMVAWWI